MSKRIEPYPVQAATLFAINMKLKQLLEIMKKQVPEGRVAKFKIKVSGRKIVNIEDLIGSEAISVSIKNVGGNKLYVGVNTVSTDLEVKPGEIFPISFNGKYIKTLSLQSDSTTAEVVLTW